MTDKDLVEFIEKESRAMLDPVFGDLISSSTVEAQTVGSKPSDRTSFATTVAHVSDTRNNELKLECKQKNTAVPFKSLVYFVRRITHLNTVSCFRVNQKLKEYST